MTDGATPPHKRRVRYSGTHPRQFEEKYKELNPGAHADEVEKVMQRGQTPAGMHRSICVDEILAALNPQPGETGWMPRSVLGAIPKRCWRACCRAGT